MTHTSPHYPVAEEIANAVTHGVGALLAAAGTAVLITAAALRGDAWHIVSCSIFGAMLVVLYTASTLYHSIPHPRARSVLRVLDHSSIFLLVAGTYTPFALVSLRGPWGWTLLGVIWSLAAAGIVLGALLKKRKGAVTAALSAVMGWTAIVAIKPLVASLGWNGIVLLLLGGAVYTVGIVFYGMKRLPWNHALWHLFVLGGSTFHFFTVLLYVIPRG
jgi:hemolysin III